MKARRTRHWAGGFTLIELLFVAAIIGIIAALLLTAVNQARWRAWRIQCIGNLKQNGVAFQSFAQDHGGRFPMQVPASEGGSLEFLQAAYLVNSNFYFSYRHFLTLSNELVNPALLVCPADTRQAAASFATLNNSNLSYFVAASARLGESDDILAGDRNITDNSSAPQSLLQLGPTNSLFWTRELHQFKGNILFADGHVEEMNNAGLIVPTNGMAAVGLLLPTVKSNGPTAGGPAGNATAFSPPVPAPVYSTMPTQIPVKPRLPLKLAPGRGISAGAPDQASSPATAPPAEAPETSPSAVSATAVAAPAGAAQTNAVAETVPVPKRESLGWLLWLLWLVLLLWLLVWLSLWFRRRE